jgi:hypothetical protein
MNHKKLKEKLDKIGVNVTMTTLRNWAKKGLIPTYTPISKTKRRRKKGVKQPSDLRASSIRELGKLATKWFPEYDRSVPRFGLPGKRNKMLPISCYARRDLTVPVTTSRRLRGRPTDWSYDAFVEAAAVWAMKHCGEMSFRAVTPELIAQVQLIAREFYASPLPLYKIRERLINSRWPVSPFTYEDVEMKLARDDTINRLTVTYITALEKTWWGLPVQEPARVTFKQDIAQEALPKPAQQNQARDSDQKLTTDTKKTAVEPPISRVMSAEKPVRAEHDEIVLLVRQPGSDEWTDSRTFVMR